MRLPESVRKLIEVVFIERTVKMRDYQKLNKLAAIEFRKWLNEQKQRGSGGGPGPSKPKKNPLIAAKLEVSKVRNYLIELLFL